MIVWGVKISGQKNNQQFNAVIGLTFLMCFNIISITELLFFVSGKSLSLLLGYKVLIGSVVLVISFINEFLFYRNEKYKQIIIEFQGEKQPLIFQGRFIFRFYVVGSIISPFAIGYIIYLLK